MVLHDLPWKCSSSLQPMARSFRSPPFRQLCRIAFGAHAFPVPACEYQLAVLLLLPFHILALLLLALEFLPWLDRVSCQSRDRSWTLLELSIRLRIR